MTSNPTGKQLLRESLGLFRQDRHLIVLPMLAAITALVTLAAIGIPLIVVLGTRGVVLAIALCLAGALSTAGTLVFNVALVFAATDRIEGRTPTVGGSLARAWGRRATILKWALLSSVGGTLLRAVEQRFGILGRLVGIAGALAWTVATFMVLPVLAFEDLGPVQVLGRSSSLLKERFGIVTRSGLRFGFLFAPWLVAAVGVVAIGAILVPASHILGAALVVIGVFGVLAVSMYACAAGVYMRTILYRFSTGQEVPDLEVDLGSVLGTPRVPVFS